MGKPSTPHEWIGGIESKRCFACQNVVPLTQFKTRSTSKDRLEYTCVPCQQEKNRVYYAANSEKVKKRAKEYHHSHKDEIRKRNANNPQRTKAYKRYREANRESLLAKNKERHRLKRAQYRETTLRWRKNNRERYNKTRRENQKRKLNNDPQYKITVTIRNRINQALKNIAKCSTTSALIGCSIVELRTWIESKWLDGMTWDNHGIWKSNGPMRWHIDHIRPCASFDLTDPEQQKICFHWTNLQPLWAVDNIEKGDTFQ